MEWQSGPQTAPPRPSYPFPNAQVCNALTRQRKEEIVADLKEKLENSVIVFGMRFKGLDVSCSRAAGFDSRAMGRDE